MNDEYPGSKAQEVIEQVRRKRGRPTRGEVKRQRIDIKLAPEMIEVLDARAAFLGMSRTQVIEEAIALAYGSDAERL